MTLNRDWMRRNAASAMALAAITCGLAACSNKTLTPAMEVGPAKYAAPIAPGTSPLRLVSDEARMPDLGLAYRNRDAMLLEALDNSLRWFDAPSSKQAFPIEGVSHARARASVGKMTRLLAESAHEEDFVTKVRQMFDVYESVGYDGDGVVLYTGYYAPILQASRYPSSRFTRPLYRRPADLVTDPKTGTPQGRMAADGTVIPYYTRQEIDDRKLLRGTELVWLEDDLSVYLVHVNGSAKLRMDDGSVMYVGYAGKTDRPYASLGQAMVKAGMLSKGQVSLAGIKGVFRRNPEGVRQKMYTNENYVFFTEYAGSNWPAGSLGVRVTPEWSLATDKKIYPRGGLVMVDTKANTFTGDRRGFTKFMVDQDTGGAIEAPGRADIFMGIGPSAEILAGGQYSEGRLYYMFLKPQYLSEVERRMKLTAQPPELARR